MQPRTVAVHDGPFHADEVVACALLITFGQVDREGVVRTRVPERLAECEYVCDVGGLYNSKRLRFDHHQASYQGPLSSAGMVLRHLHEQGVVDDEELALLRDTLVDGVDAHDNGVPTPPGLCSFSLVIAYLSPIHYDATVDEWQAAFEQALDFALGHIGRVIARLNDLRSYRPKVKEAMERSSDLLEFDQRLPWLDNFFALGGENHPARFVLMPSEGHWKLRGIPPTLDRRMEVRQPLPEEWAGLLDADLRQVTGIPGAIFCHKGRFISVWKTREDALKAYRGIIA